MSVVSFALAVVFIIESLMNLNIFGSGSNFGLGVGIAPPDYPLGWNRVH